MTVGIKHISLFKLGNLEAVTLLAIRIIAVGVILDLVLVEIPLGAGGGEFDDLWGSYTILSELFELESNEPIYSILTTGSKVPWCLTGLGSSLGSITSSTLKNNLGFGIFFDCSFGTSLTFSFKKDVVPLEICRDYILLQSL